MEKNKFERVLEIFTEKFEQIVPDRTDARTIFSLHIESKENLDKTSFTETEVKQLIKQYLKDESATEREQRQKIEERLQTLLRQQFIERTTEKKFTLTDYASKLCELFCEKIQPLLNPSEIEKTLEDIFLTLKSRSKTIEDIRHWFEKDFKGKLKAEIDTQTRALEFQISDLRNDLNEKFKSMSFFELTDYFNLKMDIVIENRKKLTKSFNGLDEISDILSETPLNKSGEVEFIQIKTNLNETLSHYRQKLEKAGEEISQIKRVASSLFDKIDKKPFYRKLEQFFYSVLEQCESEKKANRTDKEDILYYSVLVKLPDYVKDIEIIRDTPDLFKYPEFYEDFNISKNQQTQNIDKDTNHLNAAADRSKRRKQQAQRIEYWLENLRDKLKKDGEVDFSTFYLEMLNEDNDIEVAIKGTEHILKTLRHEKYKVETSRQFSINKKIPHNALWNIKIKNPS